MLVLRLFQAVLSFVTSIFMPIPKISKPVAKRSTAATAATPPHPPPNKIDSEQPSIPSEKAAPSKATPPAPAAHKVDPFAHQALCPGNSFIRVHKRLYLALFEPDQASVMAQHELKQNFVIVPYSAEEGDAAANPTSLIAIYNYDCTARAVARQNPGLKLVFCAGSEPSPQARAAFLLGCHLIMSQGLSFDRTYIAFQRFHDAFDAVPLAAPDAAGMSRGGGGALGVPSCWAALACAKGLGWIDFGRVFARDAEVPPSFINIEDYVHFARPVPPPALTALSNIRMSGGD
jgi:hypothetical protein